MYIYIDEYGDVTVTEEEPAEEDYKLADDEELTIIRVDDYEYKDPEVHHWTDNNWKHIRPTA